MNPETKPLPKTEVFVSKSDGSTLRRLWPERSDTLDMSTASTIRGDRGKVSAVYVYSNATAEEFYYCHLGDKNFVVNTAGWGESSGTPEFYQRLAEEIQNILNLGGLKIILY